jgi:hypothetical protein
MFEGFSLRENIGLELVILNSTRVVCVNDLEEWIDELSLDGDTKLGNQVRYLIDGEALTAVQVKVIEDLAEQVRIVSGELKDASLDLGVQMLDSSLRLLRILVLGYLPGRLHHTNEVFVTRGAHGQVRVIIVEFFPGDDTIIVAACTIKAVEEFSQNLILCLASLEELRVH